MLRFASSLVVLAIMATAAVPAWGQADAQRAYSEAKAAYEAGRWAEARDLARKAAQTDLTNPEVFLLLGQAQYHLGQVDEALAAWQRTLKLAPEEPYAKRMVKVLQGQRSDVDARIRLAEALLAQRLFDQSWEVCKITLADKGLSDAQRVSVMMLWAELDVRTTKPLEARKTLEELLALYPQHVDPVRTALLLGVAKLRGDDKAVADGLATLKKLVADQPKTEAAVEAQYTLVAFDLGQGVAPERVAALRQWIAANPAHRMAREAKLLLLNSGLVLSSQSGRPAPGDDLSEADVATLAVATEVYKQTVEAADAKAVTERILNHLETHYASVGAEAAAARGAQALLDAGPPQADRLPVLKALAKYRAAIAVKELGRQLQAGQLTAAPPLGPLPKPLADVAVVFAAIDQQFPAEASWAERAALAAAVRGLVSKAATPTEPDRLRACDAWAIGLALPLIAPNVDAKFRDQAADLVLAVVKDYPPQKPATWQMNLAVIARLVEALPPDQPAWTTVVMRQTELQAAYARFVFDENVRSGQDEENGKLSEAQKALVATLAARIGQDARVASEALRQLGEQLAPWIERGHWSVAEEAYTTLAAGVPEARRLPVDLAVVRLWIDQAMREHQRLAAAGLSVPRELDPVMKKALVRLYELQAGLDEKRPELGQIRQAWGSIVLHYAGLEYYEVARQAVEVKGEKPVETAEAYAALQLARLADEAARRELDEFLKQYGATEKVALSPAFQAAIAAYTKFIADRPTSPLVPQAVGGVLGIAQRFEQLQAFQVASGVYGELAKFAAGVEVLSQSSPTALSTAQQAALSAAGALDAEARKALARQMKDRKKDDPPPAKLSEEYAAAIAAYKGLIAANPDSPLVGTAIGQIMAIAMQYAKVDAWEVADGVYADLLGSKLAIRRPERLQFARGLCKLGQVMPDHARGVLDALTGAGLRESIGRVDPATVAMLGIGDGALNVGGGGWGGLAGRGVPGRASGGAAASGPESRSARAPAAEPGERPAPAPQVAAATPPPAMPEGSASFDVNGALPSIAADGDRQLLAMIRQQESSRAAQVAQLRDNAYRYVANQPGQGQQVAQQEDQQQALAAAVLSEAEIARQQKALEGAYEIFQGIRKEHPETTTAEQARAEILVIVGHWRSVTQWQRAAALAERYLADNPVDVELAKIRLEIARDRLAWASKPIDRKPSKQAMLMEVAGRFDAARKQLEGITTGFPRPEELSYRQQAQWEIAQSYLTQARVVDAFSPTLARGQYVRAAKELQQVAETYPDHPQIGQVPQLIWNISQEIEGRQYWEEAIHYPMNPLAEQAAMKVAQTYHQQLKRPLKAAEAYQELNFARGGSDQNLQNAIFQIGTELKDQKRWVEALHVLEGFVESFPRHPQAGQALTMMGHIHQTNEAWQDAVAAYRRVIDEFKDGQWVQDAKWSIAECKINLSQWQEATAAYRAYVEAYKDDKAKVEEANRRTDVLKDLARYQALVDEKEQRKAFDAQFQIARIVRTQLANPVKAIIEYRKVAANWPESHLADDALYEVGTTYLSLGETEKAREALLEAAKKYPTSPLADDALFMVGKSYEDESVKLSAASRDKALELANDMAQRKAYQMAQSSRREQQRDRLERIADLKKGGQSKLAEVEEASQAANYAQFNAANTMLFAQKADQEVEALTATQLADRQDKINAALRRAIESYSSAAKVAGADKAGDALLRVATIYDQQLKDDKAAMQTWLEIVRQFSGTSVAEDASWRIAQYYERQQKHAEAIEAYKAFLRNYRSSPKAGEAQFAIAENYEHLGQWVSAMDTYTNYITNFPQGPLVQKAKEQINWIKTYRL